MSGIYQQAYPAESHTNRTNVSVHNQCTTSSQQQVSNQPSTTQRIHCVHIQHGASYEQDRRDWTMEDMVRQAWTTDNRQEKGYEVLP